MTTPKFGNIYFETNILKALIFNIHQDPRLTNFKKFLPPEIKTNIYIPKIVQDELIRIRQKDIKLEYDKMSKALTKINYRADPKVEINLREEDLLEKIKGDVIKIINEAEIKVFEPKLTPADFSKIIDMAISEIKPFQKEGKGKGFQDAVILKSVINHSSAKNDCEHIFISEDKIAFDNDDVRKIITDEDVLIKIFFTLDEATNYFFGFITEAVKLDIEKRNHALKEFLVTNKNSILEFIRNDKKISFSPRFLEGDSYPFLESVQQINSVDFIDIVDPKANFIPKGQTGTVEVTFGVKVKFNILMAVWSYQNSKFTIGERPIISTTYRTDPRYENKDIERKLEGRGQITISNMESGEGYSNLNIEEITEPLTLLGAFLEQRRDHRAD